MKVLPPTTCLLHAGGTCQFGVLFLYFVSPRGTDRGFKIPARNKHETLPAMPREKIATIDKI